MRSAISVKVSFDFFFASSRFITWKALSSSALFGGLSRGGALEVGVSCHINQARVMDGTGT